MAICPKCKKVITELLQRSTGIEASRFFIDNDIDIAIYNEEIFDGDGQMNEYECFECGEILFEDWDEAEKFLLNKDELKELVAEKIEKNKNG